MMAGCKRKRTVQSMCLDTDEARPIDGTRFVFSIIETPTRSAAERIARTRRSARLATAAKTLTLAGRIRLAVATVAHGDVLDIVQTQHRRLDILLTDFHRLLQVIRNR